MATLFKNVSNYKRFLIRTEKELADDKIEYTLYDTLADWGMIAKTNPYPLLPKVKDPYKNDWKDKDGVEAYTKEQFYEPYEFEVKFYIKAKDGVGLDPAGNATNLVRESIMDFFEKVRKGYFSIYDEYTRIGRQKVRFVSYTEESFKSRSNWASCIFSVKFAVDDPVTLIYFTK